MRRYTWHDNGGDWAIRMGPSKFLIAEGTGFSRRVGRELYARLTSPALANRKAGK